MCIDHQLKIMLNKHYAIENHDKKQWLSTYHLLISIGNVQAPSYHCYLSRYSQYWRINSAARHRNDPLLTKPSARINSLHHFIRQPNFFAPHSLLSSSNTHWKPSLTLFAHRHSAAFGHVRRVCWRVVES